MKIRLAAGELAHRGNSENSGNVKPINATEAAAKNIFLQPGPLTFAVIPDSFRFTTNNII